MKKYFVRRAILISIVLLYSPILYTKSRTKTRSVAINQAVLNIVDNFDKLIESFNGRNLIENIIEKYPNEIQQIVSCIVKNFDKLIESWGGEYLIIRVIENNFDAKKQIISCIMNNFDKLIESRDGRYLIESIIEKYPNEIQQIIPCIVKNVNKLIESLDGIYLIENIIEKYPDARQQIISYIVKNFDRLIELLWGTYLIDKVVEKYPNEIQQIILCIIKNFDRLIESLDGRDLIENIIEKYPDARQQISSCIVEFSYRWEAIIDLIENGPAGTQIISCIKNDYKQKKITKLPLTIFAYFCEKFPQEECLRNRLKEDSHEYSIEGIIKRFCYLQSCQARKNDRLKSSLPTVKHIEIYRKIITKLIGVGFLFIRSNAFSSNFLSMLDRVFRKEVKLEKSGYIAFKHAQRWKYGLPEKWFTTLWAITKEKPVTDFIFYR